MAEMKVEERTNASGSVYFDITGTAGRHEFFRYGNFLTREDAEKVAEDLKLYELAAPIEEERK